MIAALRCGASFGAEWAGVCTALFMRPRMPWPWVHGGSNGADFPPLRTKGVPRSSEGQALKGRALRLGLAPTVQAAGEAFQCVGLDYAGSKKRSSYSECSAEKGRFQPYKPYLAGPPGAEIAYSENTNKEEFSWPLPVVRFVARQQSLS